MSATTSLAVTGSGPRLLDQLRAVAFKRFARGQPGERYAAWACRYILFHGKRHPRELAAADVMRFLEHVAKTEKDPVGCLEQAHEALVFVYENLLRLPLGQVPLPQPPRFPARGRNRTALPPQLRPAQRVQEGLVSSHRVQRSRCAR
jgi:hypothetical protein